jgi:hypothetical protein
MKSEHLETETVVDGLNVIADDAEVFDYVDDLLTEHGFESDYTRKEQRDGRRVYILHFGPSTVVAEVEGVLRAIPAGEIDRIWRLNN